MSQRGCQADVGALMKYTIEIVRIEGDTDMQVLHRSMIDAISPKWARSKAQSLLESWKSRRANGAVVLNSNKEQVYSWRED
jgi:hypothetical protein